MIQIGWPHKARVLLVALATVAGSRGIGTGGEGLSIQ